ncbi:ABC transporter permease [Nocardioides yefusunii]|uniref:ABC transporter permease n=1 Tax=Nocardioides yefusunii TaxID=2500546 RepID=A0ABW1QUX7_9ACTN|nr:FtsX-like permease family protein [Nocardioides yefusunii]
MRTVLLASLRHNRRRYVASAIAVVLGVAFIVATNGLAGALGAGMTKDVAVPYTGADVVVTLEGSGQDRATFLARAAREGAVVTPQITRWITAEHDDEAVDLVVGAVADDASMQWQEIREGRMPQRDGEALIGEKRAVETGLTVGDRITLPQSDDAAPLTVEVVGISGDITMGYTNFFVRAGDAERAGLEPWTMLVGGETAWIDDVDLALSQISAQQQILDDQTSVTQGVDVIAILVSLFAAIALMVAILVITNTFAILFAQRARDFALLRCVGVTAKQLRRSVRVEALVLGVVASVLGVALGVALAFGIAALAGNWVDVLGTASFSTAWLVAATVIGVGVTLAAAWLPTRAVTRISPLAALRPTEGVNAKSRAGVLRLLLGAVVVLAGGAVLAWSVLEADKGSDAVDANVVLLVMLAGGSVAFVGVLLLGPWLVPGLVRLVGRVVTRRGSAGAVTRLATSNTVRNPRRTATTAASLMVGVTLTTAVLAGLNSVRVTLNTEMEGSYPLDVAVLATPGDRDLAGDSGRSLLTALGAQDEIDDAVLVDGALVTLGTTEIRALAVTGQEGPLRNHDDQFNGADVLVDGQAYTSLMDDDVEYEGNGVKATLTGPRGSVDVLVRANDAYGAESAAVRPDVLSTVADLTPTAVFARAADGAAATDVQTAVSRAGVEAGMAVSQSGGHADRSYFDSQFTVIAAAVVGLLSVAVVIALIGIGNTLGLSVLERTRENSLLRAMGYTKAQMRRTLAWEGVLVATVATLLGIVIGLTFAWVGVKVLLGGFPIASEFSVPVIQIVVIVAVALAAGVLASVVPSRKAARISPAAGLTLT